MENLKSEIKNSKNIFLYSHECFIIFFILILLSSCIPKPIDLDVEPAPSKLVVSSQLIPSRYMIVALTRSFSALENPNEASDTSGNVTENFLEKVAVKNGLVTISYKDKTDTLFKLDTLPGLYFSLNTLQYNYEEYTLNAYDSTENLKITAVSEMLPKVSFDTVYPLYTDSQIYINYEFTDPDEDNWYMVVFYKKVSDSAAADLDVNQDPFSRGSNLQIGIDLLSDKTFDSKAFKGSTPIYDVDKKDTMGVVLANISEGYFRFLDAQKRTESFWSQITSEPINYPTNVEGGYGYFNTHHPDVKVIYPK